MAQRNAGGNGGAAGTGTAKDKDEVSVLVPKAVVTKIDGRIRKAMSGVGDLAGMELTDRQMAGARRGWIVGVLEGKLAEKVD